MLHTTDKTAKSLKDSLKHAILLDDFEVFKNTLSTLLTMKALESGGEQFDINEFLDGEYNCLHLCCRAGKLQMIEYLLTSASLPSRADINAPDIYSIPSSGLMQAVRNGHTDVVKYLLSSPSLKTHANLRAYNDGVFRFAVLQNNMDILKFLIIDMHMYDSKEIDNILNKNTHLSKVLKEMTDVIKSHTLINQSIFSPEPPSNPKTFKV